MPVKLVSASTTTCRSRSCQEYIYSVKVRVSNLGYDKKVTINGNVAGRSSALAATFVQSLPNNEELWEALWHVDWTADGSVCPGDLTFTTTYAVNGKTYTDDSDGWKYTQRNCDFFTLDNVMMETMPQRPDPHWPSDTTGSYGEIAVRNIAPEKKVSVVYTTDAWTTTKTLPATFEFGPNANNFDTWQFAFPPAEYANPHIQFAISYDVNGHTYWANNFGLNYAVADR